MHICIYAYNPSKCPNCFQRFGVVSTRNRCSSPLLTIIDLFFNQPLITMIHMFIILYVYIVLITIILPKNNHHDSHVYNPMWLALICITNHYLSRNIVFPLYPVYFLYIVYISFICIYIHYINIRMFPKIGVPPVLIHIIFGFSINNSAFGESQFRNPTFLYDI